MRSTNAQINPICKLAQYISVSKRGTLRAATPGGEAANAAETLPDMFRALRQISPGAQRLSFIM